MEVTSGGVRIRLGWYGVFSDSSLYIEFDAPGAGSGGGAFGLFSNSAIAGQWNHFCIQYEFPNKITLYINGKNGLHDFFGSDPSVKYFASSSTWFSASGAATEVSTFGACDEFYFHFLAPGEPIYGNQFDVPVMPFTGTEYADVINTISINPVTVPAVVSSLCTLSGLSPTQFDTTALASITRPVRALSVGQVSNARTVLEMLAASYYFDCVLSDKLYFRPRGGAPVAAIPWGDLGVGAAEPLPLRMASELEVPAQMALTYSNIENDYQTDTQYSDRLLTGQESTAATTLPLGFLATEAKQIVDAMLLDKAISMTSATLAVQQKYAALEPTDVLTVQDQQGGTWRMRVVKKAEAAGVITLDCVMDDATVFTQAGITSAGTQSQSTVAPTPVTTALLLDVPLLRDADNTPGIYMAVAGNAGWKNAAIFESLNDSTYTQLTTMADAATLGTCTTALPDWAGGNVFDEASTVTVTVGTGQLASVTRDALLQDQTVNAALIGTELVQYRTALLVSAGVYTLSGLLRGRKGTEWAMASHVVGERFVALGASGLRYLPLQVADLGRPRYYKAASAGQKLSDVPAITATPAGVALECLSPVNARANRNAADTVITWTRRTRLSTRLVGTLPISAPLGETTEAYEVEIYTAGFATLRRTISASTPTCTYTSAQQIADFGSAQSSLAVRIYQISASVGRGYPLSVTL